eukprot:scaffold8681_cov200-Amphora_coffeaeformis.AAC.10
MDRICPKTTHRGMVAPYFYQTKVLGHCWMLENAISGNEYGPPPKIRLGRLRDPKQVYGFTRRIRRLEHRQDWGEVYHGIVYPRYPTGPAGTFQALGLESVRQVAVKVLYKAAVHVHLEGGNNENPYRGNISVPRDWR